MFCRHPPRVFFLLMSTLLLPLVAVAADATSNDYGGSLLQLFFGLLLVLTLLFATLWLLKKVSAPGGGSGNLIRVVSAAAVGPRERVVVVDVGGTRLVLGVAPGRVSLLDQQEPSAVAHDGIAGTTAAPDFAQWLKRTLARRNEK